MEENNQHQNLPILCRKGCGFYGSPNFDGLCSKCHRDIAAQVQNTERMVKSNGIHASGNKRVLPSSNDEKIISNSSENTKSTSLQDEEPSNSPDLSSPDDVPTSPTSVPVSLPPTTAKSEPQSEKPTTETTQTETSSTTTTSQAPDKSENNVSQTTEATTKSKKSSSETSAEAVPVPCQGAECVSEAAQGLCASAELNGVHKTSEVSDEKSAVVSDIQGKDAVINSEDKSSSKKRPRCDICNKRVGLTGFSCRCGGLYCSIHRYSDTHNCAFDYRENGQAEIRRANPQVLCSKLNKI